MKNPFQTGAVQNFERRVRPEDSAIFDSGEVHPVYATFALGRDAEWVCRLFVLEMKDDDEEGIGTYLNIIHHSPALVGQIVKFTGVLKAVKGHEVIATFEAKVGERLIAKGETGQKILKKEKLNHLLSKVE
ncbi:MAG: thioesterase family protein [Bacteroidia bacterium]